jgi:hypothetical protein
MLNPTDPEHLVDSKGRPYFLWDCELTLDEFRQKLRSSDAGQRAYLLAKLMRQAKPDDVFQFVSPREIRDSWPQLQRHLGRSREFWAWLLESWKKLGRV